MAALFHRPKADHPGILERHLKAERVDIEGAAGGEVADHEFGVRDPHNRKWRVEIEGWYWHRPVLEPEFRYRARRGGKGDITRFHVKIERPVAAVPSDAGFLGAAKGCR